MGGGKPWRPSAYLLHRLHRTLPEQFAALGTHMDSFTSLGSFFAISSAEVFQLFADPFKTATTSSTSSRA